MNAKAVLKQIDEVYSRLISTNLSVKQFFPSVNQSLGKITRIGSLSGGSIALRDLSYEEIYSEIESNNSYHIKLPDGGLLIFQYMFDNTETLEKHRLSYFPSSVLPTFDEAPTLYENDELYGDVVRNALVRFPIRFDYDPAAHQELTHPKSHLTLGQYENCRIPVESAVSPHVFMMFLLRNFYFRCYQRNKNKLERKPPYIGVQSSITAKERRVLHLVNGM